ncbi:hypothetical protein [Chamaesiphon sp. OTE_8_metabat_110]|uniref:hypothetical protein n=1 Tax=Chamaesiphon sp. OTE_8_metabat_110 TaxID=2964696 RepID=UPI00286BB6F7|nr:hypothetical protein [Chamaesiphon sp. OTE_8_metabat_110]
MKPEEIKEILRMVDEFNAIDTGDVITKDNINHQIIHLRFTHRQKHLISFMRGDELTSIDRDEYVVNNWTKVSKETLEK